MATNDYFPAPAGPNPYPQTWAQSREQAHQAQQAAAIQQAASQATYKSAFQGNLPQTQLTNDRDTLTVREQAQIVRGQPFRSMMQLVDAVRTVARAIEHDELTPQQKQLLQMRLACDFLSAAQRYPGGPLTVADNPFYESTGHTEERAVEERVEKVCEDLKAAKVVPRQMDQLAESVRRAQHERETLRAIRLGR